MDIKKIYKKHQNKKMIKMIEPYVSLNHDSIYADSFCVDLRHPQGNRKYLIIGSNCVIDGTFVFETNTGEIRIGNRCHIGSSTFISKSSITIGDDVTIAWGCCLYDHNSHSVNWDERKNDTSEEYKDYIATGDPILNKDWSHVKTKPIVVKDKAWIGMNAIILKGVTIGEGAVVGAGSVVTKDVADWTVVAGNPAQVVKKLKG